MSTRALALTAILLLFNVARAGGGGVGGGAKLQVHPPATTVVASSELKIGAVRLSGRVTTIRWTSRHGRTVTQTLPFPRALGDLRELPIPAGEWSELTVVLEGGLLLSSERDVTHLDVRTLDLVLAEPLIGGGTRDLGLEVPEDLLLSERDPDALRSLVEDAVQVVILP